MNPRVLIPMFERRAPNGRVDYGAGEHYLKRLTAVGIVPILVAPGTPANVVDELYGITRGLFLMGGEDIDPSLYGEAPHPQTQPPSSARDALELELTKRALADGRPILGICRGCQMLAVASGGKLVQHVPDIAPQEQHRAADTSCPPDERLPEIFHDVHLDPTSSTAQLFNGSVISLNSSHHQAVACVGASLRIVGTTAAGVVEIIESADPSLFVIGVQAHPELINTPEVERLLTPFRDKLC